MYKETWLDKHPVLKAFYEIFIGWPLFLVCFFGKMLQDVLTTRADGTPRFKRK